MERVKQIAAHFSGASSAIDAKRPDDVVITMAIRSPMCKSKKGGFKDMRCVLWYAHCARELMKLQV